MSKIRSRSIIITACIALFALLMGLAFGLLSPVTASAAEKTVRPSSIFWGMTGGEVEAYSVDKTSAEGTESFGYVTLVLGGSDHKEGAAEYHRDLALKWYTPVDEKPEVQEGTTAEIDRSAKNHLQYFSLTFSFPKVVFDTFTITFSSAEENVTKDGKAVNEVIFKNTASGLSVFVKNSALQDDEHKDYNPETNAERLLIAAADATHEFTLALSEEECKAGEFAVTLNGDAIGDGEHSKFTNVGGYFMEYRTSSPQNVPMTFKAVMPEGATESQKVFMRSLNGQSLKVTGGTAEKENDATKVQPDGTVRYENGMVTDDTPPALVLNQKLYAFTLGQKFSLDYNVMDVCYDGTPSVSRYYYIAAMNGENCVAPEDPSVQLDEAHGYRTLTTSDYFIPRQETLDEEVLYASIRFTVSDGRDGATDRYYYYLDWYADENAVKQDGDFGYIRIDREKTAPYYKIISTEENKNVKTGDYQSVVDAYQAELDKAAKKASAGDGAYFYLPSLRNLIGSDSADYRNLRFSIYYYKPGVAEGSSASSETSLRYNNLRFEIEEPGRYKFRIMAADAAGNTMQMYLDEGDGEVKLTPLSSGNIWDVDEIPDFTIDIDYTGAVIEPVEDTSIGYRGTSYSVTNFEIVAYGNSQRDYTLYYMDAEKIKAKGLPVPTLKELTEDAAKFLDDERYNGATDNDPCFIEIHKYNSDISKDDEEAWKRTDNDYNWNPSSTPGSFTPQESGLYIVKLTLTDALLANTVQTAYQAIDIRNPVDVTPAQIDWLENNVTSVVLFSISAVLAVVIVVLFVVKPAEKNVEDVDLDKLKGKKKGGKK